MASQSLSHTLKPYCETFDDRHHTAYEVKTGKMLSRASKRLGVRSVTKSKKKNWDDYFTFGFVRHPYTHFLSVYLYLKKHKVVTLDFASYTAQQKETGYSSLADWNFKGLYDRISDADGNIIVDFVGRFENLAEDWSYVAAKIGLPGLQLHHINQTVGSEMRLSDYYTPVERKIVQDLYRQDFEMLGYES
ncbi:sulfotransferase family 2 domain-containing protein [Rariglobus hedericola]|uniref:sulfotransferase family 2 domain-containing protein n=1 Tax=Rariglobus hedericola TaxID=2597822 RepID=UPI001EF139A5|nr:sulfotransferase family 2 domain-containing protein [Rariglobus hedericola]